MKLHVIGSSSAGNGYVLEAENGALVIEAGVPLKAVKRVLDYNIGKVAACLVTHEHGDHAGRVNEWLRDTVVPVCGSNGTVDAVMHRVVGRKGVNRGMKTLEHGRVYRFGEFSVIGMRLEIGGHYTHDAAEPYCYQIHHAETGTVLFATDTYCIPYRFGAMDGVLVECNYAQDILDANVAAGVVDRRRRKRIVTSHMSLETCIHELTHKMDAGKLHHVVLIHGSEDNSDPERFRAEVSAATGRPCVVAHAGMTIDFGKQPF